MFALWLEVNPLAVSFIGDDVSMDFWLEQRGSVSTIGLLTLSCGKLSILLMSGFPLCNSVLAEMVLEIRACFKLGDRSVSTALDPVSSHCDGPPVWC